MGNQTRTKMGEPVEMSTIVPSLEKFTLWLQVKGLSSPKSVDAREDIENIMRDIVRVLRRGFPVDCRIDGWFDSGPYADKMEKCSWYITLSRGMELEEKSKK